MAWGAVVPWRDTATTAISLGFSFFCLTICISTDYLDSYTCTALGNRNFAFELYRLLQAARREWTSRLFATGQPSMMDNGQWKPYQGPPCASTHLHGLTVMHTTHDCNRHLWQALIGLSVSTGHPD